MLQDPVTCEPAVIREREMLKHYTESRGKGISYIQYKGGRMTGLVTSYEGTVF